MYYGRSSLFKETIARPLERQTDEWGDFLSCLGVEKAVAWAVEKAVAWAVEKAVGWAVAILFILSIRLILENYVADVLSRLVKQFLDSLYLGFVEVAVVRKDGTCE